MLMVACLILYLFTYLACVCMCDGQTAAVGSLLLPCRCRESNSAQPSWQQAPLLTEPSCSPVSGFLDVRQVVLFQAWTNKIFQLVTKNAGFSDPLIKEAIHQKQFQMVLNPVYILKNLKYMPTCVRSDVWPMCESDALPFLPQLTSVRNKASCD